MTSGTGASARQAIDAGHTALGIELGSTRIKATLIGSDMRRLKRARVASVSL